MHLNNSLNIDYLKKANIDWILEIVKAKLKTIHSTTSCIIVNCAMRFYCLYSIMHAVFCLHLRENVCLGSRILGTNWSRREFHLTRAHPSEWDFRITYWCFIQENSAYNHKNVHATFNMSPILIEMYWLFRNPNQYVPWGHI